MNIDERIHQLRNIWRAHLANCKLSEGLSQGELDDEWGIVSSEAIFNNSDVVFGFDKLMIYHCCSWAGCRWAAEYEIDLSGLDVVVEVKI